MKPYRTSPDRRSGVVSIRLLAGIAALCLLPLLLLAGGPGWWAARNATNGNTANDYAAANQGQLKNIATAAYNELNANLPGGVGDMTAPSGTFPGGTGWQLSALISSWSGATSGTMMEITGTSTNDYAAVNLGQLKTVAVPFYNRLIQVGYTNQYPWLSSTNAPNDYAAANIGQVKNLFSFDVTYDSDGNGLPDWWETHYFGHIGLDPNAPAPNRSGQILMYDYQHEINPLATGAGASYVSGTANPGGGGAGPQQDPDYSPANGSEAIQSDPNLSVGPLTSGTTEYDTTAYLAWTTYENEESIIIQRRDSSGAWHALASVNPDTNLYQDPDLLANTSHLYRLVITYNNGQTVVWEPAEYDVPLFTGMSVKQSITSLTKQGISAKEFVSSGSVPNYYLVDTLSVSNEEESGDDISNEFFNYITTYTPSIYKIASSGSVSYTDTESGSSAWVYNGYVQGRSKGNPTKATHSTITFNVWYDSGGGSATGVYALNETYQADNGTPQWIGLAILGDDIPGPDYNLSTGVYSLVYSGTYTANNTDYDLNSDGSETTTDNLLLSDTADPSSGLFSGTSSYTAEGTTTTGSDSNDAGWFYTPTTFLGNYGLSLNIPLSSTTPTELTASNGTEILSQPYTTGTFISDAINQESDYQTNFTDNWFNWGYNDGSYWGFYDYGVYYYGWPIASRNLVATQDTVSITKSRYKLEANPSAPGTSVTIYDIFVPADDWTNPDGTLAAQIVGTHTFTGGTSATESDPAGYEIDPSTEPDAFTLGSKNGTYYVTPGAQFAASGEINGVSGADPVNNFDSTEKVNGSALLSAGDVDGVGAVSGNFSISNLNIPGAIYTLTWTNGGYFKVVDNFTGETITSGYQITQEDLNNGYDGTSFTVIPYFGTPPGTTIQFTLAAADDNGDSLGGDTLIFTTSPKPVNYTIPFDEASGPRYRKIGLNGRPLSDEKPQHTAESDEEKEETYIDALNLGLHHSTTDVYVPVAGSDLTITARRDTLSEVWNMQGGLRPHERLDRPFGAGWTSNLTASLETVATTSNGVTYYYVTDQNGASHRFFMASDGSYIPLPSDHRENGDYLTTLNIISGNYVFTDRYGTQITFLSIVSTQTLAGDRYKGTGTEIHKHYPVSKIKDRFGNTLDYHYPTGAVTLIPDTITLDGHSDQVISIEQNATGQITDIWDPDGNHYTYHYGQRSYSFNNVQFAETVLTSVTAPDGAVTTYGYDCAVDDPASSGTNTTGNTNVESDLTPVDASGGETINKYHIDVNSITDPLGNNYLFTYQFDQTKWDYNTTDGYFQETGASRNVVGVTLPGGLGSTALVNNSNVRLAYSGTTLVVSGSSHRETDVTDATGQAIIYTFGVGANSSQVFNVGGFYPNSPPPKIVFYLDMKIDYGSGLGYELFTFDPTAGLALSSVTDFSGNTTSYVYGDTYPTSSSIWGTVFPYVSGTGAGFFSCYEDPTLQTNALSGTKTFQYSGTYRIMDSVKDENGRLTTYNVDSLGRRTNEIKYAGDSSSTSTVQQTNFSYDSTFTGVVSQKTVVSAGDPSWASSLEESYILDSDGRVAEEAVINNATGGPALITQYTYDPDGCKLSATDPLGRKTWFSYDARNRLTAVTYPDGTQKTFAYDARGNKTKEYDENGIATLYQYDALNRVVKQARDMNGNGVIDSPALDSYNVLTGGDLVTQFGYNAVNSKTSVTDTLGNTATMAYDALQRLTSTTQVLNSGTTYTTTYAYSGTNCGSGAFDTTGFKPTSVTDPLGFTTTVTYDKLYRATAKSTVYASGSASATSTAYDAVGNATSVTDPLGNVTQEAYDALNRVTQVTFPAISGTASTNTFSYTSTGLKYQAVDENGVVMQTQYDFAGRPVKTIGDAGGLGVTTQTGYDADGNVVFTKNPLNYEWDYTYDLRNRKIVELDPAVTNAVTGAVSRPMKTWEYDNVGNVLAAMDARLNRTDTIYDAANRLVRVVQPPDTAGTRPCIDTVYDADGNVLRVKDSDHHVTTNTYDALNRLSTTTDAAGNAVTYTYDGVGNRKSVTDGNGHATQFTYDGLKRNLTIADAGSNTTTFAYDALNKTGRTDALGQATAYTYDARNRLAGVSYTGRSADDRTYSYDAAGDLTGVTVSGYSGAANVAYTYDTLRRVLTESSGGLTHDYSYDPAGNRVQTVYGGTGRTIASTYDPLNRLSTMTENARVTGYGYDLDGNVVKKILPNGDNVTTAYDALNRALTQTAVSGANQPLYQYSYTYDLAGNVLDVGETYPSGLGSRTVANTYDSIYRLSSEADTISGTTTTSGYTYDAANNRLTKTITTGTNVAATDYAYNAINQLTAVSGAESGTFSYDANGNRAGKAVGSGTDAYSYDYENRLVGLVITGSAAGVTSGTYAYTYDYRTRRVTRDESGAGGVATKVVYSGGTSVEELSGTATTPTVEYVRGSDWGGGVGGVLYTLRSGTPSYTHENRRGDVVAKTNASGSLTYQAAYDAFGKRSVDNGTLMESGTTADRQKANTKDEDPTGLLDEGFRYRDLDTGEFITKDPAGFVDGPNLYTYVRQNPWTSFDPEGLEDKDKPLDLSGSAQAPSDPPPSNEFAGNVQIHLNGTATTADDPPPESSAKQTAVGQGAYDDVQAQAAFGSAAQERYCDEKRKIDEGAGIGAVGYAVGDICNDVKPLADMLLSAVISEGLFGEAGILGDAGEDAFSAELAETNSSEEAAPGEESRQTMATGREWYDYFASKYGAQNVDWTSGSGKTISWPSELPMPDTQFMIRVPPPISRSSTFASELENVAGPRPANSIAHHNQPLGLGGVDDGATNGSWLPSDPHQAGHGLLNPQVNTVPYGTQIIIKPQ